MKPLVLVILDGWGLNPVTEGNAIFSTPTPNYDKLLSLFPNTTLHASGEEVGLSWGEMGNSEVGHLNLGTGRVILQDLPRIEKSITNGSFFTNAELIAAINHAKQNNSNLHLLGLFSSGGVHSHLNHLLALLDLAKKEQFNRVFIHLISDGRDTPPQAIQKDLPKLLAKIKETGIGQIASLSGRYYAMDRDKRKERTEKAFKVLTEESAPEEQSISEAIQKSYAANKSDEFIDPVRISNTQRIKENDALVFFNFRSDRARQISELLIKIQNLYFCSFTNYGYEPTPLVKIAFFAEKVSNQLASLLGSQGVPQLHVAETEKYPHVTYFFNGGIEQPFTNEERILVPSPKVATYDLKPEMSAKEIAAKFIDFYNSKKPIFTVVNFANADMVGHTGSMAATQKAVATLDNYLGEVANVVLNNGGDLLVTADHGNAEQMINPQTGEMDKEHTTNPVPFILGFPEKALPKPAIVSLDTKIAQAAQSPTGVLADVTATIIKRLGLTQPAEITGQSLSEVI